MIHGIFGRAKGTAEHPYFGTSSGFSGREGVEKREIYAVALGGHHFYDLFLQGQGGHDSFAPWIRYWGRGKTDFLLLPPWAGNMFHCIEFCFGDFLKILFGKSYFIFFFPGDDQPLGTCDGADDSTFSPIDISDRTVRNSEWICKTILQCS